MEPNIAFTACLFSSAVGFLIGYLTRLSISPASTTTNVVINQNRSSESHQHDEMFMPMDQEIEMMGDDDEDDGEYPDWRSEKNR